MKNTTDLSEDGSRYTKQLNRHSLPVHAPARWGLLALWEVPDTDELKYKDPDMKVWMAQFPDGWRYVHAEDHMAYVAAPAFEARTGYEAWLTCRLMVAVSSRDNAIKALNEAEALVIKIENARAAEIARQPRDTDEQIATEAHNAKVADL